MATIASLLVKLGLDGKKFDKGIKKALRGMDQLARRAEGLSKLSKLAGLTTLGASAIALTAALGPASAALLALPAAAAVAGAALAVLSAGLAGMGDAMAAVASGDAAALEEALKGLAPSAQSFVRSWAGIRESFAPVQQAVQQRLFAGLGEEMSALATGVMPTLDRGMTRVADSLNSLATEAMSAMNTPLFKGALADTFDGTSAATESFGGLLGPLTTLLLQLSAAGLPLVTRFTEWATGATEAATAFLGTEAGAARLSEIVTSAGDTLAQLGTIVGNLAMGLGSLFGAASGGGQGLLDTITQLTERFREWAASAQGQEAMGQFFDVLAQAGEQLLTTIPQILGVLGTLLGLFQSLPAPVQENAAAIIAWSVILGPVIGKLSALVGIIKIAVGGIGSLVKAAKFVGPHLLTAATAVGRFSLLLGKGALTGAAAMGRLAVAAGAAAGRGAAALGRMAAAAAAAGARMAVAAGQAIASFARMAAAAAANAARVVAGWVLMGIQSLIQAARMALAWFIALGPVGWVIAAVIALVALIIAYWDQIVAATVAAWEWIKNALVAAWNWIVNLFMTYHPVGIIISHWDKIKAFTAAVWAWIKAKVSALWNGLVATLQNGIARARAFIVNGFNAAKNLAIAAFLALHNRAVATVSRLVSFVRSIPGRIKSALGNLGSLLTSAGRQIIQGLINGVTGMIGSLRSKFSEITGMIPNWKGPMSVDLKLLEPAGEGIMTGLNRGIEKSLPGLRSTLQGVTREIPSNVSASVRHTGGREDRLVLDVTGADEEWKRLMRKMVRTEGRGNVQLAFGR